MSWSSQTGNSEFDVNKIIKFLDRLGKDRAVATKIIEHRVGSKIMTTVIYPSFKDGENEIKF